MPPIPLATEASEGTQESREGRISLPSLIVDGCYERRNYVSPGGIFHLAKQLVNDVCTNA